MKTLLAVSFSVLLGAVAPAQVLRPELVNGAVFGGLVGAVIGNNSGDLRHNAWQGAAIGAGAGLLLGSLAADANDRVYANEAPPPAFPRTYVRSSVYWGPRFGDWHGGHRHHGFGPSVVYVSSPSYYASPAYYDGDTYGYDETNYAGTGALLGGIAGAIIGNNSGDLRHNGWRGAAIGAAAGYVFGSIADRNARARAAAAEAASAAASDSTRTVADAPLAPAAATVPAAPTAPASPMASANGLFGR